VAFAELLDRKTLTAPVSSLQKLLSEFREPSLNLL